MAGVSTLSFEIAEALVPGPAHVFSPAGGGGLTLAVARGFEILAAQKAWAGRARIHCVQPAGNDTIATPLREGLDRARAVESHTAVSGLQVGGVLDGDHVRIAASPPVRGPGPVVTDDAAWRIGRRAWPATRESSASRPARSPWPARPRRCAAKNCRRTNRWFAL